MKSPRVIEAAFRNKYTLLLPHDVIRELYKKLCEKEYLARRITKEEVQEFTEILTIIAEEIPAITEEIPRISQDKTRCPLFSVVRVNNANLTQPFTPEHLMAVTALSQFRYGGPGGDARYDGYALSQEKRKQIREIFGWLKTVGGLRQTKFRGLARVGVAFTFAVATLTRSRQGAA